VPVPVSVKRLDGGLVCRWFVGWASGKLSGEVVGCQCRLSVEEGGQTLFIPLAASPIVVVVVVVLVVGCFLGGNSGISRTAFNLIDHENDDDEDDSRKGAQTSQLRASEMPFTDNRH
jgi:hypothetical protein